MAYTENNELAKQGDELDAVEISDPALGDMVKYYDRALGKTIIVTRATAIDGCIIRDADGVWHDADYHRGGPYVPPPPPSARAIARLGDKLDALELALGDVWAADSEPAKWKLYPDSMRADDFGDLCDARFIAEMAYADVLGARALIATAKAENAKRVPTERDRYRLRDAQWDAADRLRQLRKAGSAFYTAREYHDAETNYRLATDIYRIAEQKVKAAEHEARADKRAGIVRTRASRTVCLSMRSPNE